MSQLAERELVKRIKKHLENGSNQHLDLFLLPPLASAEGSIEQAELVVRLKKNITNSGISVVVLKDRYFDINGKWR